MNFQETIGIMQDKSIPILSTAREWLMKGAELIARGLEMDVTNVYSVILLVISLYVGKKIFNMFNFTVEGKLPYFLAIAGGLFYILRYVGA